MPMTHVVGSVLVGATLFVAGPARGDDASAVPRPVVAAASAGPGNDRETSDDIDLRLTLSSFLYRETGADAPARVDQGATLSNASPVRRYFGDLRAELGAGGLALDARVRQTTSARYQAGAAGGGEYEIRTLDYRLGSVATQLTIGRQVVDAVGATRIDGAQVTHKLSDVLAATVFGGTYPALGSRSLDTDYVRVRASDGSEGARLVPIAGGIGVAYQARGFHGDLGAAAVRAVQDVPDATAAQKSRVFTTASGYWRLGAPLDIYHFAVLDVAGERGVVLTNGSVGVDARPTAAVQLTVAVHHVSTDVLQIAARNLLDDPDPSMIGVVQNNLAVVRVSQDAARASASVALADHRFELSASGGVHRRPEVDVALADGSGALVFSASTSADAAFAILDRRSLGGLRIQASGNLTFPAGGGTASRARGTLVRLSAGRTFSRDRGQIEVDVMAERFRDVTASSGMCMTSLDAFACFGASKTTAAQAGALVTWRIGRDWLVLADAHAGYRDVRSTTLAGPLSWPKLYSVTSLLRVQWRYR
jgi:hypothetical protein